MSAQTKTGSASALFERNEAGNLSGMTALFRPFGLIAGLLAGLLARKIFEKGWGSVSDLEPPSPEQRDPGMRRLILALLLEGAIFTVVRGLVDHGARVGFQRYTGAWPGDEATKDDS